MEPEDAVGQDDYQSGEPGADFQLEVDEASENIAADLAETVKGREALGELTTHILDDFEETWDSNQEHREKEAENWALFGGNLPGKDWPFENCANVHWPLAMENTTRLMFRAFGELFGDMSNVVGVHPVGPDDEQVAKLLSQHGNWQLRERIPDFKQQMFRGMLVYFYGGDVTAHSFYDPLRKQNRHEILTCDEFCVPYTYVSTMPDYSDCPARFRIFHYQRHELENRRDLWRGVDKVLHGGSDDFDTEPMSEAAKQASEADGIEIPTRSVHGAFKVIQFEGWLTLPGEDRQRFCQAHIAVTQRVCMSLTVHEEPSWEEVDRYRTQQEQLNTYEAQLEEFESAMAGGMYDVMQPPLPPEPPAWLHSNGAGIPPMESTPIHMFSHGVCIPNVGGNLGFGFGRIQADMNRAANTMGSQFIDQATLSNAKTLLTTSAIEFERPYSAQPGKINKVKGSGAVDLHKSILPMEPGPANPQLMETVDKLYDRSASAMQAPSVLSGESGKSGETFRGISARIEQATKQVSVATGNYADPFVVQILRNNARLNAIFLAEEEFFYVNNHEFGDQMLSVGRAMYRRPYTVSFRSDLKFTSEASKIADADQMVSSVMQMVPALQQSGGVMTAFLHKAMSKALEARGRHEMVPLLGPAPPPPTTPFGLPPPAPPQAAPPEQGPTPDQPGPNGPGGPAPTGQPN